MSAPAPSGVDISKVSVPMVVIWSANTAKLAAPRGMSTWLASEAGLPVSRISAARNSSKRAVMPSTSLRSSATRSGTLMRLQGPLRALRAAVTARSTSSAEASVTSETTSSLAG